MLAADDKKKTDNRTPFIQRQISEDMDSSPVPSRQQKKNSSKWNLLLSVMVPGVVAVTAWAIKTYVPGVDEKLSEWDDQSYGLFGKAVQTYTASWATEIMHKALYCVSDGGAKVGCGAKALIHVVFPVVPASAVAVASQFASNYPKTGWKNALINSSMVFVAGVIPQASKSIMSKVGFFCGFSKEREDKDIPIERGDSRYGYSRLTV